MTSIKNWKEKLKDKCWYWVGYATGLKNEDIEKYSEVVAKDMEEFIEEIKKI